MNLFRAQFYCNKGDKIGGTKIVSIVLRYLLFANELARTRKIEDITVGNNYHFEVLDLLSLPPPLHYLLISSDHGMYRYRLETIS